MKRPIVILGNGETFQDILVRIKLHNPKLKFPIPPLVSLEKEFGKKEAGVIRRGATARGAVDHRKLGDDY